jgi:16S rRNA (guanine527-N7)-methyltransferase
VVVEVLEDVLSRSRDLGFLGPGPIEEQVAHAQAFLAAIETPEVRRAVDLGSGGGVPGLVLAVALPRVHWVLLDGMVRRTTFLVEAIEQLGVDAEVWTARAEDAGRVVGQRGQADLVVARGFGPPAVTAECAAPLLAAHGQLVVSEPPDSSGERWPATGLRQLGLELEAVIDGPPTFVRMRLVDPVAERFPRRVGVPTKRPLW